jgi:UPF0716 protein FxsA
MGRLLLLFIVVPAVELALLIELGRRIGTVETLALIVVTGIAGASMARSQGLRVLQRVQQRLEAGEMPADSVVDGLMILIASALLITPGILTDAFGFLCLVPAFRGLVKRELLRRFEKAVAENRVHVDFAGSAEGGVRFTSHVDMRAGDRGQSNVVDVTPRSSDE